MIAACELRPKGDPPGRRIPPWLARRYGITETVDDLLERAAARLARRSFPRSGFGPGERSVGRTAARMADSWRPGG